MTDGLYPITETMPCLPRELNFGAYLFPGLNKAEMDEAAARLCLFSWERNEWVGVSYGLIAEQMLADLKKHHAHTDAYHHNFEERFRVENAQYWWKVKTIVTLGLWALFVKRPKGNFVEEPEDGPFSIIYVLQPDAVDLGLNLLIKKKLVRIERVKEGDREIDVLYPTPALLERAMPKNKRPTVH